MIYYETVSGYEGEGLCGVGEGWSGQVYDEDQGDYRDDRAVAEHSRLALALNKNIWFKTM